MKIRSVKFSEKKRVFEVKTSSQTYQEALERLFCQTESY